MNAHLSRCSCFISILLLIAVPSLADPAELIKDTYKTDIQKRTAGDGSPDLKNDSFSTLKYIAKGHILNKRKNNNITSFEFRDATYTHPDPAKKKNQNGYIEARYRLEDDKLIIERFQFIKEPHGWRVFSILRKDQIRQAHPIESPDPNDPLDGFFTYLIANKIEEDIQRQLSDITIWAGLVTTYCGYSPPVFMGDCKASYIIEGQKEPIEKVYVFRLTDKGWILDRELRKSEKVNYKTGTIDNLAN